MLLDNGIKLHKIGAQIPEKWTDPKQVQDPSSSVLREPDQWPAKEYIASTIHVVRKFMGPSAQVGYHELWAEVGIDNKLAANQDPKDIKRLLILDGFRDDREAAEIIRTARGMAWDAGILSQSSRADIFSPEGFRAGRLQTLFFPIHNVHPPNLQAALNKAAGWECKPIFLRPLPDSELDKSQVGRPHFWKKSGEPVDLKEVTGQKIALVVSQTDQNGKYVKDDDICLSIPLSISPSSPHQELTTLPVLPATALAMSTILNATQDEPLAQPTGLKMSHSEWNEGRMLTKNLAKILQVPRPLSGKQQRMLEKKRAYLAFKMAWEETEFELDHEKLDPDNFEEREAGEEDTSEEEYKKQMIDLKKREYIELAGQKRKDPIRSERREPKGYIKSKYTEK